KAVGVDLYLLLLAETPVPLSVREDLYPPSLTVRLVSDRREVPWLALAQYEGVLQRSPVASRRVLMTTQLRHDHRVMKPKPDIGEGQPLPGSFAALGTVDDLFLHDPHHDAARHRDAVKLSCSSQEVPLVVAVIGAKLVIGRAGDGERNALIGQGLHSLHTVDIDDLVIWERVHCCTSRRCCELPSRLLGLPLRTAPHRVLSNQLC